MDYFVLKAIAVEDMVDVSSESEFVKITEAIDLFCRISKIKEYEIYKDANDYDRFIDRINELFIQLNIPVVRYSPEDLPCDHEWVMGLVPDYDTPFDHYSANSDIISKTKETVEAKIEQALQEIFNAYEGLPFSDYLEHQKG